MGAHVTAGQYCRRDLHPMKPVRACHGSRAQESPRHAGWLCDPYRPVAQDMFTRRGGRFVNAAAPLAGKGRWSLWCATRRSPSHHLPFARAVTALQTTYRNKKARTSVDVRSTTRYECLATHAIPSHQNIVNGFRRRWKRR
jgi:hypothetical protein